MKKLVFITEKGGVGKTALTVQIALYLVKLGKRVIVLDLDVQNNASMTIRAHGAAAIAPFTTYGVLTGAIGAIPNDRFVLVPEGTRETLDLESRGSSEHSKVLANLVTFLKAADDRFDVCLMDTSPRADICHNIALMTADYFVAPLVLSQHAIEGVFDILYSKPWGYEFLKEHVNPTLELLGILPVMVESKPVQQEILKYVQSTPAIRDSLLTLPDETIAQIPRLQAIEEAQNTGMFVADLKKTSGREAWRKIQPVFDVIVSGLELEIQDD